jgi:hypothetical protein
MMRHDARAVWVSVLAGAAVVAMCATVAITWERIAGMEPVPADHDLATVLVAGPNRIVTVDLEEMRVVRDVGLRSLSLDMSSDASIGLVVTAQCGGVSTDADDAVGLYDPRRDPEVAYVRLKNANPGLVAVRDGTAYVEHGLLSDAGLLLSVVGLRARAVSRTTWIPDGPGASLVAGRDDLFALAVDAPDSETSSGLRLFAVDRGSLETRTVAPPIPGATVVVPDGQGGVVLLGKPSSSATGASAARLPEGGWYASPRDGLELEPVAIPGLRSADVGCVTAEHVVAGSWGGDEPTPGRSWVAWIDRAAPGTAGRLKADGGVSALAPWGERVVMVERDPCRLVVIDPVAATIVGRIDLGYDRVLAADVEVLPGRVAQTTGR